MFENIDIQFAITIGLSILFLIILSIYLTKKFIWKAAKNRLENALEQKGLTVDERITDKKRSKLLRKGLPSDKELQKVVNNLQSIIENEKLLKERERIFTSAIKKLHSKAVQLTKEDEREAARYARSYADKSYLDEEKALVKLKQKEVISNDIKKVLNITDELLGHLPEEKIEEFSKSEDFKLYKKVMKTVLK